MGMAASQGRLLMMTARLSNNEFEQQCVAYSKQKLADDSMDANDKYLEALNITKYQVITGYKGNEPTYEDVTYNLLTGLNNVAMGKQYIVNDNKGRIVVSEDVKNAFKDGNGDFNKFLAHFNVTQSDIDVTDDEIAQQKIHDAWDKYLVSVYDRVYDGKNRSDVEHNPLDENIISFSYHNFNITDDTNNTVEDEVYGGYPTYVIMEADNYEYNYPVKTGNKDNGEAGFYVEINGEKKWLVPEDNLSYTNNTNEIKYRVEGESDYTYTLKSTPLYYEGSTAQQRELYDYAVSITAAYYHDKTRAALTDATTPLDNDKTKIAYYKNIYNQMLTKGFTTLQEMKESNYIRTELNEKDAYADDKWLITQLKAGRLTIAYYSAVDKDFVKTTLDDDESITEKEDKSKIAIAQQQYQTSMDKIEREDKMFDLQLNKLESEHTALQTEYESVSKVISKNVEKSFNIFNA